MAKPEKLLCDSCGKEELEEETTEWITKLIPNKDFCSQKCAAKYIKKEYKEDDKHVEEEGEKEEIKEVTTVKKQNTTQGIWELRNVASQFTPALYNTETKEATEVNGALALILNRLDEILKRL